MPHPRSLNLCFLSGFCFAVCAHALEFSPDLTADHAGTVVISSEASGPGAIAVDPGDYSVVTIAANLLADDLRRVSARTAAVTDQLTPKVKVVAGTLGHSRLIDELAAHGKLLGLERIKGKWEATLTEVIDAPAPGLPRALVIVGSDRRGTAFGLLQLSAKMGVSPWYWWADVPVKKSATVSFTSAGPEIDQPGVQYRGVFINDEDWGLHPWSEKNFEAEVGANAKPEDLLPHQRFYPGPKTYEKIYELLLRLRLNYIWPAMHPCSGEFDADPENAKLAGRWGIVAGASHCEPMLRNNARWNEQKMGKWDYSVNRKVIYSYWEDGAKTRGNEEAVWGIGIRGIHDWGMEGPPGTQERIQVMQQVFHDERELIAKYVTSAWGPISQCFVPYKEVLKLYDGGLKVPDDVTLVWVDDNFGYIRRLSGPKERARSGGAGLYWHLSYYGGPHSYTWIDTTAPALMWEELSKAWENNTRRLWVINVGDLKPAEPGIDYFARLAWSPEKLGPASQPAFLYDFARQNFRPDHAEAVADVLGEFYRLGTIRKPELMSRPEWSLKLSDIQAGELKRAYTSLLNQSAQTEAALSPEEHDAFTELVGFPVQVLAKSGLIFLADREACFGRDPTGHSAEVRRLRKELEQAVEAYNNQLAGGKWRWMMPGLETGKNLNSWNSQVRWPWGEPTVSSAEAVPRPPAQPNLVWRPAGEATKVSAQGEAHWAIVAGLGASGQAAALKPAAPSPQWNEHNVGAPSLLYTFTMSAPATADTAIRIAFLPTFRLYPGLQERVAVSVDGNSPELVEVPGSSGEEDELGGIRSAAVQANRVEAVVPEPGLAAGPHTVTIRSVDPGPVIDEIGLPK